MPENGAFRGNWKGFVKCDNALKNKHLSLQAELIQLSYGDNIRRL